MEREGVAFLRIEDLTEAAYPDNRDLFGERIHPNHAGHRMLGLKVLERLVGGGMLQGLAWDGQPSDG
jgi:hypothetical protein